MRAFWGVLVFSFGSILVAQNLSQLTYMTEDSPPANYVVNGQPTGIAVELIKEVWKAAGVAEQPIVVYPWARGYEILLKEPNHVLFSMGRSPDREKLFKWAGPINSSRLVLVGLKKNNRVVADLVAVKDQTIGVIRSDFGQDFLTRSGFPEANLVAVHSIEQLVNLLRVGRIDHFTVVEDLLTGYEIKTSERLDDFSIELPLFEGRGYFAFQKDTSDALVAAFQNALQKVEQQRLKIVKKYGRTP